MDITALLRIVNGEDKRLRARCARVLLRMLVPVYWLGITIRNRRFDAGRHVIHVDRPVISIGNITTGGTGKTPFVMWLLKELQELRIRPVLLSRGYSKSRQTDSTVSHDDDNPGSSPNNFTRQNDEAREIGLRFPDVVHRQNPDRVAAAQLSLQEDQPDLFLLDDGFQHRRLARDLDILLIDATCPFGYGRLLPAGLLREPLSSISRADLIVLSRCEQVDQARIAEIHKQIKEQLEFPAAVPIFEMKTTIEGFFDFAGGRCDDVLGGKRVVGFCGIGNPDSFRFQLESAEVEVLDFFVFPDHHEFTRADLGELVAAASSKHADMLVCTRKDRVKIETWQESIPLVTMDVGTTIDRPQQLLDLVKRTLSSAKAAKTSDGSREQSA